MVKDYEKMNPRLLVRWPPTGSDVPHRRANRKGPLFRSAIGKTGVLTDKPMPRTDVWYMVRRRAADAGIETPNGCNTFRATGITDYLSNGGRLEVAQRMAGPASLRTTSLYDRRHDDISVGEVERIGFECCSEARA